MKTSISAYAFKELLKEKGIESVIKKIMYYRTLETATTPGFNKRKPTFLTVPYYLEIISNTIEYISFVDLLMDDHWIEFALKDFNNTLIGVEKATLEQWEKELSETISSLERELGMQ